MEILPAGQVGRADGSLVTGLLCVGLPGKVAIQKEDLQKYHNRDTWFQLQHVDADSEVQVRLAESTGPGASGGGDYGQRNRRRILVFSGNKG